MTTDGSGVPWPQLLAVASGSAAGGLLRWRTGEWLNAVDGGIPLGTLAVNAVGGLLVGAALAWFAQAPNETLRLLLVTGFLGGLTTFSSFTGESLSMLQRAEFGLAAVHTLAHVLGALGCAALGHGLVRRLLA